VSQPILPAPGTISIAHNSATITGVGTIFQSYRKGYLIFSPGYGIVGQLASDPDDDFTATLVDNLGGATDLAGATFQVFSGLGDAASQAERVRQLVDMLSNNALGIPLIFDDSVIAADPGAGKFRLDDDVTPTHAYFSYTSASGKDITGFIQALDDVANAVSRASLSLRPLDGANAYLKLKVTGAIVDHGTWAAVPIGIVAGAVPANKARLAIDSVAAGADGAPGANGTNGTNGTNGANGVLSAVEVIKTADYNMVAPDTGKTIVFNKATAINGTFAAAATLGAAWAVLVKNIGAGALTLDPNGAETIDGAATLVLGTGESALISSNGTALRTELRSFGDTMTRARANLGSGATGDALFTASVPASARGTLGSGVVGDAVFLAATKPAAQSAIGVREVLTANRTYFVDAAAGSDTNAGLSAGAGNALQTLSKAFAIVLGNLDLAGHDVTIQLAAGTYNQGGGLIISSPQVGSGNITVLGDTTTPSNVVITGTGNVLTFIGVGVKCYLAGLKLQAPTAGSTLSISTLAYVKFTGKMEFGACPGWWHIECAGCAVLEAPNVAVTISGNSSGWLSIENSAYANLLGTTWTASGTITWASSCIRAQMCANIIASSNTSTGTFNGTRYSVSLNAAINTNGGGASAFPGSAAGATTSGGQYA